MLLGFEQNGGSTSIMLLFFNHCDGCS